MYQLHGLIQASDYNGFRSLINQCWGQGAHNRGYGQLTVLDPVSVDQQIRALEWFNGTSQSDGTRLLDLINRMSSHQIGPTALDPSGNGWIINANSFKEPPDRTIPNINNSGDANSYGDYNPSNVMPTVAATNTGLITFGSNVNDQVTITTGIQRMNAYASGTVTTRTGTRTTMWGQGGSVTSTIQLTFDSADRARYFFNAGGLLKIQTSRTGGSSRSQNTDWSSICSAMGTLYISAQAGQTIAGVAYNGSGKVGGGGISGHGYHEAPGVIYTATGSASYSSNEITVEVSGNGTATIYVSVKFDDGHRAANQWSQDYVDGTLAVTATVIEPATTYIQNSWGSPSLTVTNPGGGTGSIVTPQPTPVVPTPAPTVSVTINPSTVAGDGTSRATLTWTSTNATSMKWYLDNVLQGAVAVSGSILLDAFGTAAIGKTFVVRAEATGPGGSASAQASLTVSATAPATTVNSWNPTIGPTLPGQRGVYSTVTLKPIAISITGGPPNATVTIVKSGPPGGWGAGNPDTITSTATLLADGSLEDTSGAFFSQPGTYIYGFDFSNFTGTIVDDGSSLIFHRKYMVTVAAGWELTVDGQSSSATVSKFVGDKFDVVIGGTPGETITYTGFSTGTLQIGSTGSTRVPLEFPSPGTYTWTLTSVQSSGSPATYTAQITTKTYALDASFSKAVYSAGEAMMVTVTGAPNDVISYTGTVPTGTLSGQFNLDTNGYLSQDITGGVLVPPGSYSFTLNAIKSTGSPKTITATVSKYQLQIESTNPLTVKQNESIPIIVRGAPGATLVATGQNAISPTVNLTFNTSGLLQADVSAKDPATGQPNTPVGTYQWLLSCTECDNTQTLTVTVEQAPNLITVSLSNIPVQLYDQAYYTQQAWAAIRFNPDGSVLDKRSNATYTWATGNVSNPGSKYWIRWTSVQGNKPKSGTSTYTPDSGWVSLSSAQEITVTAGPGQNSQVDRDYTIQIASDSSGSSIIATHVLTMIALTEAIV